MAATESAYAAPGTSLRTASALAGLAGAATAAVVVVGPSFGFDLSGLGIRAVGGALAGVFACAAVLMAAGGVASFRRPALGGSLVLIGVLTWLGALLFARPAGYAPLAPAVLGFAGAFGSFVVSDRAAARSGARLIYRQNVVTRLTHWLWAVSLFFLLLSGLQIFNAHPALYIGEQSGFAFDNAILRIGAENTEAGPRGYTILFGNKFDTSGVLGKSGSEARPQYVGFPGWTTIPSYRDLATGRVVHFFFGWVFVATMFVWFVWNLFSGHIRRDVVLTPRDAAGLPTDIADHARLRFGHGRGYTPLQKLAYSIVFFVLFPLIILTGLTMSPGMDASWQWLTQVFGGRQTARTIHFLTMSALVLFFVVHIVMVFLANPFNELRSMVTGWYRASPETPAGPGDRS